MKYLGKLKKVILVRFLLFFMVFGCLGAVGTFSYIDSSIVYAASSPPKPTTDVKDYNEQLNDAETALSDGNGKGVDVTGLADSIKPEQNSMTNLITNPIVNVFNAIMYIALSLVNTYFFVQTCFDIGFLMAPAFRNWLTANQDAEAAKGKATRFMNGMISEAALKAVAYSRQSGSKTHIENTEMVKEVDWKGWIWKRLWMMVCVLSYVALLFSGLLGDFVNLVTKFGYAIIKGFLNLVSPGSAGN